MQFVKPVTNESCWILNKFFSGRADFLMQQAPQDRMETVATYLAQQIKVKLHHNEKSFIMKNVYIKYFRKRFTDCLQAPIPCDPIVLQLI